MALVEVPVTYAHLPDYEHADIDVNLREMERNARQWPSPDYVKTVQGGRMSKSARADLVSWMDDFTRFFNLAPGTLHRASPTSTASSRSEPCRRLTAAKYKEQCTRLKVNATCIAEICGLDTSAKEVIDMELILNPTAIHVRQWNRDFEELTGYKPTDVIIGILSLYFMDPDPRFNILSAFLEGQIMDFNW